jgi:hypothetical protein
MTDEEMAKAWTRGHTEIFVDEELGMEHFKEPASEESYLAGLKAGRPKWHKAADGDLPEEETEVLNDDGVEIILINGHWRYVYGSEWEDDAHVDHWCEIPKYTEEE